MIQWVPDSLVPLSFFLFFFSGVGMKKRIMEHLVKHCLNAVVTCKVCFLSSSHTYYIEQHIYNNNIHIITYSQVMNE